jgi:hypothetical protein
MNNIIGTDLNIYQSQYKCKLTYSNKDKFDRFLSICKSIQIPDRHIKFNSNEQSCLVSSPHLLIALGLKNREVARLTGFHDYGHHPLTGYNWQDDVDFEMLNTDLKAKEIFFKSIPPKEHSLNLHHRKFKNETELIQFIFQKYSGLIIGERSHSHINPKKFVIDHLPAFKQLGVKTLYLEHLFYDVIQTDLDDYYNGSSMSSALEAFLDAQDQGQGVHPGYREKYGLKALVQAAQENHIRVVAIDTEDSYMAGADFRDGVVDTAARNKALSYQSLDIIQKTIPEKFIAFVGASHVCENHGVLGLSELLGVPNFVIGDTKEPREKCKKSTHAIGKNRFTGTIDIYLEQPLLKQTHKRSRNSTKSRTATPLAKRGL